MIVFDAPRAVAYRRFKTTSHMASTLLWPESTAELLAFAVGIGLKTEWIQNRGEPTEHFDLFDGAIERARQAGAEEVDSRRLIALCVRPKREAWAKADAP